MNFSNKFVSIIMPAYNAAKSIADSISSVIAQTYTEWELLIIDDCSNDETLTIIQSFVNLYPNVKYFKTAFPSGSPAIPRNIGIENAKGRYIAFLDADDLWLPNKLEVQLPLFDDENVAIVFSDYEKINSIGLRNNRIIRAPLSVNYSFYLMGNCIGNLTAIYDTAKVGKVFQKKVPQEDYLMYLDILARGYIAKNVGLVLGLYRVGASSFSANKLKQLSWQWIVYRKELKLNIFQSGFYYLIYAWKALKKYLK